MLEDTIHIWHTKLEYHTKKYKFFRNGLSLEEKKRAEKLALPYGYRFIISRGLLRNLLAYYTHQPPEQLCLSSTPLGKPLLINPLTLGKQIEFNLSHSKNRIAYAFTFDTPIGIDLEYKTQRKYLDKIAYRFLPACNYEPLKRLTGEKKLSVFFNAWVHNEALLKALGQRLHTHPLSQYKAALDTSLIHLQAIKRKVKNTCWLSPLSLHPDFAAAVAVKGTRKTIIIKEYTDDI